MTILDVSHKRTPDWLSISRSLRDWGLFYWEAACLVWSPESCVTAARCSCARVVHWKVSHQQLDRCLAATVWAATYHSNSPMHHSRSPLAAWKPHKCTSPWRHRLKPKHVYQKPARLYPWAENASDENGKQPVELHWSIDRSVTGLFYCVFQSQKQTLWTFATMCFYVTVMTFKAYTTAVEQINLCFVSQGRVRTAVRRGGQFCCNFVANFLWYPCAKKYENIAIFDKVTA